jgi:hypothetical protein
LARIPAAANSRAKERAIDRWPGHILHPTADEDQVARLLRSGPAAHRCLCSDRRCRDVDVEGAVDALSRLLEQTAWEHCAGQEHDVGQAVHPFRRQADQTICSGPRRPVSAKVCDTLVVDGSDRCSLRDDIVGHHLRTMVGERPDREGADGPGTPGDEDRTAAEKVG